MFFKKSRDVNTAHKAHKGKQGTDFRLYGLSTLRTNHGFTLVELMVVVAIFVFMTALVVANYGSFNDGTLLTSMSYDISLALADAQSYGINTEGVSTSTTAQGFNYPYGMDFNIGTPSQMMLFADSYPTSPDGVCDNGSAGTCTSNQTTGDNIITTYTLARGGLIKCLFVGNTPPPTTSNPCPTGSNTNIIDVTFKRPDPNAIIMAVSPIVSGTLQKWAYAVIQVEDASKTATRSIVVNETGEIAVQNQ